MKVLAIGGSSDSGKTTLVERLAGVLSERGTVGTVKHIDCGVDLDVEGKDTARHRAAGAARTYGITDGEWFVTGDTRSLDAALDDLARTCEYALVEGYRGAALPRVELGAGKPGFDRTHVLARARSADAVELPALLDAVEDLPPYVCLPVLVSRIRRSPAADGSGAIATLAGRVPRRAGDGGVLVPPASGRLGATSAVPDDLGVRPAVPDDLCDRDEVREILVGSRDGLVESEPGAAFVVVLADDRDAAFRAVEDAAAGIDPAIPRSKTTITITDESPETDLDQANRFSTQ